MTLSEAIDKGLFTFTRELLKDDYLKLISMPQNAGLLKLEQHLKLMLWSDEEIRIAQLLMACKSNASLLERNKQLEATAAPFNIPVQAFGR